MPAGNRRAVLRADAGIALGITGAIVTLLALVYLLYLEGHVSMARLMRDPAISAHEQVTLGALSHLGVLGWMMASGICLFTAIAVPERAPATGRVRFLLWAGLLTALLGLDDLFLIHDHLLPTYAGIPEPVVYMAYAAAAGALLLRFRDVVRGTAVVLLGGAAAAFALSTGIDIFLAQIFPGSEEEHFVEDGLKLLGIIALWGAYLARMSTHAVSDARAEAGGRIPRGWNDDAPPRGRRT